jgi:hypothetical protein
VCREPLEGLESRIMLSATTAAASANRSSALVATAGYTGTIYHGVDYNPTWPNWSSTGGGQLSDSDFFNNAFAGLWGQVTGARAKHVAHAKKLTKGAKVAAKTTDTTGRNDLGTIASAGLNEVRLYNWGPTRGWDGTKGTGHLNFLNYANSLGVKVMVPVSNYFVGDDQFSWNGATPDAAMSWDSAPQAIRQDLVYFVSSITVNGQISPAVQSIEIGNELDIASFSNATARLERAEWWVVNLQSYIVKQFGADAPHPLLTIPVSNADQGANGSNLSWFEIFANGVKTGQMTPNGTTGGDTFTEAVNGLASYDWYTSWFFNSYQTYQYGQGLTNLLQQYDTGGTPGTNWPAAWPGQTFSVPLMLTEIGIDRITAGSEDAQYNIVANLQAQVIQNYLATPGPHNIMGYDIFEFNDEPNKNDYTGESPQHDEVYGIFKYYNTSNIDDFRSGTVSYTLQTGDSPVSFGTFASIDYPVYQLVPLASGGVTLIDKLKSIFAQA